MAALVAVGAMTLFTAALTINHFYAPKAICGCWFSVTLGTSTFSHIIMNLTLLGIALTVFVDTRLKNAGLPVRPNTPNALSPS
jgi:hypothetical protein